MYTRRTDTAQFQSLFQAKQCLASKQLNRDGRFFACTNTFIRYKVIKGSAILSSRFLLLLSLLLPEIKRKKSVLENIWCLVNFSTDGVGVAVKKSILYVKSKRSFDAQPSHSMAFSVARSFQSLVSTSQVLSPCRCQV